MEWVEEGKLSEDGDFMMIHIFFPLFFAYTLKTLGYSNVTIDGMGYGLQSIWALICF